MRGSRTVFEAWRASRTAGRRARNLRHGARRADTAPALQGSAPRFRLARLRAPRPAEWIAAASVLGALAGAFVIAGHARHLSVTAGPVGAVEGVYAAAAFHATLPGAAFTVAAMPGITLEQRGAAALLIASNMRSEAPLRIDLCSQMADSATGRLLPLRLGYQFSDVAAWVARNASGSTSVTPRNVVLAAPGALTPRVEVSGVAKAARLRWEGVAGVENVHWIGDAGAGRIVSGAAASVPLGRDGWLLWTTGGQTAALRLQRRASASCAAAGELQVQLLRPAAALAGRALVMAYGAVTDTAWLPAGRYQVPVVAAPALEDQALFAQLVAGGLLRLGPDGLIMLAPRDLAAWRAAPGPARAAALAGWEHTALDPAALKRLERLYHRADGDFVRAQVELFNSERRLLAWRTRPQALAGTWQASVGGAPATVAQTMPAAAARLFAQLPQGWDAWRRIQDWPGSGPARLTYTLAQPAQGTEILRLIVLGGVGSVAGARLLASEPACTGRACPAADAAQELRLGLLPGATSVRLDVAPMQTLAAPGDAAYRHIGLAGGKLAWQSMAARPTVARASLAPVTLVDRNGAALWRDGAPSAAASAAGLAPLLGYRADQANSIAGMLGRVGDGGAHAATLTLDLALQAASQGALDCIGMRRGRWDGSHCTGGMAAPDGRHAGMVILDTETGDVLAAAGAGTGQVDAANWAEVRDFDRLDPARSPLRLPALQHDGGAHRSPGSSFKVISALGLELAAQRDPQLDALMNGIPLAEIDRLARSRGFAFQTDAPAYPWDPAVRQARITNYREQLAGRRAQDGRLGMAQALTWSLNTWFAWTGELSDRSLFGRGAGGAPDLAGLEPAALESVRPIVAMAHRLGFERQLRLDGGLLPDDFNWSAWDALQTSAAHIDPIHSRHELRQMAIGLRMQATPLQMALAAAAVGQGRIPAPRLLLALDGRPAVAADAPATGVRLDRIRAGMKGVVDVGTAAHAFGAPELALVRRGLSGKTGTAPTGPASGSDGATATVWFTGWLEPGSLPGQRHRLGFATFVSHSEASGGDHAAPVVAAVLRAMLQNQEKKGKSGSDGRLVP
ncbi:penicillin-binding transpeptidase domain-containing protein [Massilia sp. S19_KUP03_FR1]|uniref:penicillin-binding transpeptidase domain-containing protein n=1 Tax=Massilia sp. S19_KUP03_FR1 TaxID=3025503 RepID=UPI002FCDBAAD